MNVKATDIVAHEDLCDPNESNWAQLYSDTSPMVSVL